MIHTITGSPSPRRIEDARARRQSPPVQITAAIATDAARLQEMERELRSTSMALAEARAELARLEAPSPLFISALTFGHDGAQLAASSENGVMQLWNLTQLRRELRVVGLDWVDAPSL